MAIVKNITNTTLKSFVLNWNLYPNGVIQVKTLRIPPKALNMSCEFADEKDFLECKNQNARYFVNGDLIVGNTTEKQAVKQNEINAKSNLKEVESKINNEVKNITENANTRAKNKNALKVEVTKGE